MRSWEILYGPGFVDPALDGDVARVRNHDDVARPDRQRQHHLGHRHAHVAQVEHDGIDVPEQPADRRRRHAGRLRLVGASAASSAASFAAFGMNDDRARRVDRRAARHRDHVEDRVGRRRGLVEPGLQHGADDGDLPAAVLADEDGDLRVVHDRAEARADLLPDVVSRRARRRGSCRRSAARWSPSPDTRVVTNASSFTCGAVTSMTSPGPTGVSVPGPFASARVAELRQALERLRILRRPSRRRQDHSADARLRAGLRRRHAGARS